MVNAQQKLSRNSQAGEFDNMALVGILSTQMIHQMFVDEFPREPEVSVLPKLVIDRRSNVQADPAAHDISARVK